MSGAEEVIDPQAWWLRDIRTSAADIVLSGERSSDRFTVFDGWIPRAGAGARPDCRVGTDGLGQQARDARRSARSGISSATSWRSSRPTS